MLSNSWRLASSLQRVSISGSGGQSKMSVRLEVRVGLGLG